MEQRLKLPFINDLGEAWKAYTGLPFVFAAWVAKKELEPEFIKSFNEVISIGLSNPEEFLRENPYNFLIKEVIILSILITDSIILKKQLELVS